MRRSRYVFIFLLGASCLAGCGGGDGIWVTGVLRKGGEKYTPPEGRKLALYFCPMGDAGPGKPASGIEMARYDERDGSFTVPGRDGNGIVPGKYRIAVIETFRRETFDEMEKATESKPGQPRMDRDRNLLEGSFGEESSPFIRDLKTSTRLTLDMANPTE